MATTYFKSIHAADQTSLPSSQVVAAGERSARRKGAATCCSSATEEGSSRVRRRDWFTARTGGAQRTREQAVMVAAGSCSDGKLRQGRWSAGLCAKKQVHGVAWFAACRGKRSQRLAEKEVGSSVAGVRRRLRGSLAGSYRRWGRRSSWRGIIEGLLVAAEEGFAGKRGGRGGGRSLRLGDCDGKKMGKRAARFLIGLERKKI
ncbi:mitochondrial substrate carrier family protein [Striga asiatica]|uniref:Mitochondrial substrate carrier family protein n=1 Tax=Striga asiatica TaxID=4170 RepID=A0A5A7P3S4_STRAF|nr:mitochondrial substrate carrier family protein [Striga asiatica]